MRKRLTAIFILIFIVVLTMIPAESYANDESSSETGLLESNIEIYKVPSASRKKAILSYPANLTKYDSREQPWFDGIRIKDQLSTGLCWAFASTTASEISYAKEHYENTGEIDVQELSPAHLGYFLHKRVVDPLGLTYGDYNNSSNWTNGGNYDWAMQHLATYSGFGLEINTPFDNNVGKDTCYDDIYAYDDYITMQNGILLKDAEVDTVKSLVYQYGAIAASISSTYLSRKRDFLYDYKSGTTNHAVVVLGWDDHYSKENFRINETSEIPSEDGAWIVQNSWGSDAHDNGYFYMSYESFGVINNALIAYDLQPADTYEYNYQYDGTCNYFLPDELEESDIMYDWMDLSAGNIAANIYTAQDDVQLDAVGFTEYNYGPTDYQIEIYTNLTSEDDPESGVLRSSTDAHSDTPGFKTMELDQPVGIHKGDRFSILIKLKGRIYFATEYAYSNEQYDSYHALTADHQSFLSEDNGLTWMDMNNFPQRSRCFRIKGLANKAELYQVTFTDGLNNRIGVDYVLPHQSAVAPAVPNRNGYTFVKWDTAFNDVTKDITVNAIWEQMPVVTPENDPTPGNSSTPENSPSGTITITKLANPITIKGRTVTIKHSRLRKKTQTIKRYKAIKVSNSKGKVTYKLISVNKKKFKKYFRINKTTGNLTVKKGLKKGTYKLRIRIQSSGNAKYKAKSKIITVKVRLR